MFPLSETTCEYDCRSHGPFIHLYIQSCVYVCFIKSVKAGKLNLSELEFFNGSFFGQSIAKDSKLWT